MAIPLGNLHNGLLVHRSGEGGPAVVFLPGAGLVGLDFLNVQALVSEFTTSVLYDRAGTGWSASADLPRTAEEVAVELREVLSAAAAEGPYVLVGHSIGGFYARRYAQLFPDEVAGMVLLDPGHEDIFDYLPARAAEMNEQMKQSTNDMPDLTDEQVEASRAALRNLYAGWPEDVLGALVEYHLRAWRTGIREASNLETDVHEELRRGGKVPEVPTVVLSAGGQNLFWAKFVAEDVLVEALAGLARMHADMAGPRGEHRVLDGASHQYLTVEQPDAVVRAVRDVVELAR
ncbi:alpha/beta fold hydrolase [Umezawaea sp. NPDC059074]|uniref:alpha/beta fold hydrolase n=1 Tax=Umezawaea sp. NPDC059074 TaxID=3346716 RepID=UPI003673DE15